MSNSPARLTVLAQQSLRAMQVIFFNIISVIFLLIYSARNFVIALSQTDGTEQTNRANFFN